MDGAPKIYNVSRDVPTPLSGTFCRPLAGTSYDQPVHQWVRSVTHTHTHTHKDGHTHDDRIYRAYHSVAR